MSATPEKCEVCGDVLVQTREGPFEFGIGVYCRSCGFWWAANMGCSMAEAAVAYREFYSIPILEES